MSPSESVAVIHVRPRVRRKWLLRLGLWFISKASVEVIADGKSLGRQRFEVNVEGTEP